MSASFFSSTKSLTFYYFYILLFVINPNLFYISTKQVKESWFDYQVVESAIIYEESVDLGDYDAIHYKDNTSHDRLEDKVHFKISPQPIKIASIAY
jgi:hypothetical protein